MEDQHLGQLIEDLQWLRDETESRKDRDTLASACNALRAADGLVVKHPRVEDWIPVGITFTDPQRDELLENLNYSPARTDTEGPLAEAIDKLVGREAGAQASV